MSAILENALRDYGRKQFFHSVEQAYAALQKDPKRWQEELKERREWDLTLGDGLEND